LAAHAAAAVEGGRRSAASEALDTAWNLWRARARSELAAALDAPDETLRQLGQLGE
jgi:hypothetical protein